ncbi:MAG: HmuY family protein [Sandaracinus sp.]|nr:HmuY family protein [Sandaracinus sp.]
MRALSISLLFALLFPACADDLGGDPTPDGGVVTDDASTPPPTDGGPAPSTDRVRHTDLGEGVTETLVDGTATEAWVLLDLDRGGAEVDANLETDTTWDLAIQRYHLRTNGGAGGPANVQVAVLDGVAFDDVTQAPSEGWRQDEPPATTEIPDEVPMGADVPSTVFSNEADPWYVYDGATHELTPKLRTYVLQSTESRYFAIALVDYYSPDTAASGYPAFRWKEVAPPDVAPMPGVTVDASSREAWVYVRLDGSVVEVTDEASSSEWDLALRRTAIRTNGGVSGPGFGGAREDDRAWATIESTTTVGFAEDTMLPIAGPPGSGEEPGNEALGAWYDYDPTTHAVSPREAVFAIRGAAGDYAKLRVLAWEDGVFRLELAPIAREVDRRTSTIEASDATAWTRFSFRRGAIVEVETDDTSWDVAFSRTLTATNSGTAGPGEGGAARAESSDLDAIVAAATEYTVDVNVPPSRPGASAYDGNAVLGAWFDYDPTTHVVSPSDAAFLVRTADGGHVKLRITGWADGVFTIDWAYAGAGRDEF